MVHTHIIQLWSFLFQSGLAFIIKSCLTPINRHKLNTASFHIELPTIFSKEDDDVEFSCISTSPRADSCKLYRPLPWCTSGGIL